MSAFSEIHLHAWFFSNPCRKVLIIVEILWSPDLRVQHILYFSVAVEALYPSVYCGGPNLDEAHVCKSPRPSADLSPSTSMFAAVKSKLKI